MVAAIATVILPISSIATGVGVLLVGQASAFLDHWRSALPTQLPSRSTTKRSYRVAEQERIVAALKANEPILVVGAEGSGKSFLAEAVSSQLRAERYTVVALEPATQKQMLIAIALALNVPTQNLDGKAILIENLKQAISEHLHEHTAFLIVDNAHKCSVKFRDWLKALKKQGVPLLLTATNPPKSDIFINLPRLELAPLPEHAIRELMKQEALSRGMKLKPYELVRLQEQTGGNPMLAKRVVQEERLELAPEAGDRHRYVDVTPLVLLVGMAFIVVRFPAIGINNPAIYILTVVLGIMLMGLNRIPYKLPKESQRSQ